MDGNRRWAKERNLPIIDGHKEGVEAFTRAVEFVIEKKIPHAIFYSFSSENWQRSEEEVSYLISLFAEKITELGQKLKSETHQDKKARIKFVGDLEKFPDFLQKEIYKVEEETKNFTGTTIWIALSYGGRAEILQAVNKAIEEGEMVTEETFSKLLWTEGMHDPDLLIRTGGQKRLSNFLPWQSTYSELVFIDQYWPEVTTEILQGLIDDFSERQRSFGK